MPPGVVTVTGTAPSATCAGATAVIVPSSSTVNRAPEVSNVTAVA